MDGMLQRAMEEKETLELIYLDGKQNMSQRKIRVVEVRDTFFLAYCYSRKKVRSFRKQGVLSIYPVKGKKGAANG